MRCYLAYVLVAVGAIIAVAATGYVLMLLGLNLVDPNDKAYSPFLSAARTLPGTIVVAIAVYPLLDRVVFRASACFMRYTVAWVALILFEEGSLALVVAGVLSGPQAALFFIFLAIVPGFFLMRDWVFNPQHDAMTG